MIKKVKITCSRHGFVVVNVMTMYMYMYILDECDKEININKPNS